MTITIPRLGDPHVKVSNLEESEKMMQFFYDLIISSNAKYAEILGDLFHQHSIVRLEVLDFWERWFEKLSGLNIPIIVLRGNHDESGDHNLDVNALSVFKKHKNVIIVDNPLKYGNIGYVSYCHSNEDFIKKANDLFDQGCGTIVCHQTFQGSKYESGIYAPDGIDPDLLKADQIISGHIHSKQRFGKVIYPGTAKWDTLSDANEEKGITVFRHDLNGYVVNEDFYSTEDVCKPIKYYEWKEGRDCPTFNEIHSNTIELVGSYDWINKNKKDLIGKVNIKTQVIDSIKKENRKAGKNLEDFLTSSFQISETIDKKELMDYLKGLKIV